MSKGKKNNLDLLHARDNPDQGNIVLYTKFIKFLRITLPILLVVITVVLFTWPQFKQSIGPIDIGIGESDIENTTNIVKNPEYKSKDKKGRPYSIIADEAEFKGVRQDEISLNQPKARIKLSKSSYMDVKSDQGVYRQKSQNLNLDKNVLLKHSEGYTLVTDTANMDLKQGIVHIENPVSITSDKLSLVSKSLIITNAGKHIKFKGYTKLVYKTKDTK